MNSWPSQVPVKIAPHCALHTTAKFDCPKCMAWLNEFYERKYLASRERQKVAAKPVDVKAGMVALYMFTVLSIVVLVLRACGK